VTTAADAAPRERVGLLGGTFDPVHMGHLLMAQSAIEAFGLSRLLFVPSHITPHKLDRLAAAPEHRLAMLELVVTGQPNLGICKIELERSGVSYTVDTIKALQKANPYWELWFIIGMDSLRELHLWHHAQELVELCQIGTLERPGIDAPHGSLPEFALDAGRRLLGNIAAGRRVDVSSSEIRLRIAENRPIRYLVPKEVEDYIFEHHLYAARCGACGKSQGAQPSSH
jgi:nicotinate-nucleotide adenylyltransferase